MAKYLIQAGYSQDGIKGVVKDGGTGRRTAVEAAIKALGGRLEAFYFGFSESDIYAILGKQASIAAIAGYLVGAAMAYGMAPLVSKIDLKLIIPNELAIAVFFGALVMCLLAAMISFRKVASIDPALVFRG